MLSLIVGRKGEAGDEKDGIMAGGKKAVLPSWLKRRYIDGDYTAIAKPKTG